MTRVMDLSDRADHAPAVQAAIAELEAGQLVLLPDDCGWCLYGLPTREAAIESLSTVPPAAGDAVIALAHPVSAADYVEAAEAVFHKLSTRGWPGPLILRVASTPPSPLLRQWSPAAQTWSVTSEGRAFTCPADEFTQTVLAGVSAPALARLICSADARDLVLREETASLAVLRTGQRFSEAPTVAAIDAGRYRVERAGVVSERMLARLSGEVYLFVCTGNTCRSPMAEALFRRMLADRLGCREDDLMDQGFVVLSAGLSAPRGAPASPEAVELLLDEGIDLRSHESQPLTEDLLFHSDHILTMTRRHREAVLSAYPELSGQVQLLSPDAQDVSDPIGAGLEEYSRCREEIGAHLRHWIQQIDFRAQARGGRDQ